jgi:hypothetical protein
MPILNKVQIAERLRERLDDLRNGKEVAARDLRALLTDEQAAAIDAAWAEQQALRKLKRARTKEEEQALGWLSKRDIQIKILEHVLSQADDAMLETIEEVRRKVEVRQARIYLDSYKKTRAAGKTETEAQSIANNDLTRAGLRRVDGKAVGHINQRDRDVWALESQLKKQLKIKMSAEELEQIELLAEHERAWANKLKKRK